MLILHPNRHKPDYLSLSNLQLVLDYTGLVTNTTNSYGAVDASNNVTNWITLSPGVAGRSFQINGSGVTLTADGINFNGSGRLRNPTTSNWNFLSYPNTLKWTMHIVLKIGTGVDPGTIYGIIGNNAGTGSNKGICVHYNDGTALNNRLTSSVSTGSGHYALISHEDALMTNQFFVLTIETDGSLATATRQKVYINGVLINNLVISTTSATTVTSPTYNLDIGSTGNSTSPFIGKIKELAITSDIDTSTVRSNFINQLIYKHIQRTTDGVQTDVIGGNIYNIYNDSRYQLNCTLLRSVSDSNILVDIINDWTLGHTYRDTNQIAMRRSTDDGVTWSSKTVIYDPASHGDNGSMDVGGHVDPNDGVMHIFVDTHDGSGTSEGTVKYLLHYYSSDDGVTWTEEDLSSLISFIPSDHKIRMFGNSIKNGTVTLKPFYTVKTDISTSSRFLLRKDGANSWTVETIETSSSYRNEFEIIALSSTHLLAVAREDYNFEYVQYISTDNGLTWTNQGALTFGENFTFGSPLRLKKFKINGSDVIVCYYFDRANERIKAVYGTAANLIANGLTGWNLSTKMDFKHFDSASTPVKQPQYGDISHKNDSIEGYGVCSVDDQTGSTTALSVRWYFRLQTWHYSFLKTTLGL